MFSSSTSLLKVEESSELNAALPVNSSIACEDVRDRRGGGGEEGRRGGGKEGRRRRREGGEERDEGVEGQGRRGREKRDHTFAHRYKTLSIQSHSQHTTIRTINEPHLSRMLCKATPTALDVFWPMSYNIPHEVSCW